MKKVFGIGLYKTGTKTLRKCLIVLGYRHYTADMDLAVQAKDGNFTEVFRIADRYDSFEDWPWFLIYKMLEQRYPEAKFILTVRKDVATHMRSLKNHHKRQGLKRKDFEKPQWWDKLFPFPPNEWDYEWSAKIYENHISDVIDYFKDKPEKLLIVCWEKGDGWHKLCLFLNKSIPPQPFPHENKSLSWIESWFKVEGPYI